MPRNTATEYRPSVDPWKTVNDPVLGIVGYNSLYTTAEQAVANMMENRRQLMAQFPDSFATPSGTSATASALNLGTSLSNTPVVKPPPSTSPAPGPTTPNPKTTTPALGATPFAMASNPYEVDSSYGGASGNPFQVVNPFSSNLPSAYQVTNPFSSDLENPLNPNKTYSFDTM